MTDIIFREEVKELKKKTSEAIAEIFQPTDNLITPKTVKYNHDDSVLLNTS